MDGRPVGLIALFTQDWTNELEAPKGQGPRWGRGGVPCPQGNTFESVQIPARHTTHQWVGCGLRRRQSEASGGPGSVSQDSSPGHPCPRPLLSITGHHGHHSWMGSLRLMLVAWTPCSSCVCLPRPTPWEEVPHVQVSPGSDLEGESGMGCQHTSLTPGEHRSSRCLQVSPMFRSEGRHGT